MCSGPVEPAIVAPEEDTRRCGDGQRLFGHAFLGTRFTRPFDAVLGKGGIGGSPSVNLRGVQPADAVARRQRSSLADFRPPPVLEVLVVE